MKYRKEIKQFIGSEIEYDEWGGGYLWGKDKEGLQMIAQVVKVDEKPYEGRKSETPIVSIRGWGAIQHLFTTREEQCEFQDELGIFIQDAINEKLKSI